MEKFTFAGKKGIESHMQRFLKKTKTGVDMFTFTKTPGVFVTRYTLSPQMIEEGVIPKTTTKKALETLRLNNEEQANEFIRINQLTPLKDWYGEEILSDEDFIKETLETAEEVFGSDLSPITSAADLCRITILAQQRGFEINHLKSKISTLEDKISKLSEVLA